MIFDTHAHYDDIAFDEDRDELIEYMHQNGVDYIVNAGEAVKSSLAGVEMGKKYDFVYSASGIHPEHANETTDSDIVEIEKIAKENKKVVAIGEIGLDYHYEGYNKEKQIDIFKKQLKIAKDLDLPVIIHSRDASQDTFDIIKESGIRKGIIHCYSGSAQMAADYVKMGFFIGIGGVLTYKNARKLVEVAEEIDINNIVLETDCPYLAPAPFRGKRNNSLYIQYVAEKMAEIKGISYDEVCKITSETGKKIFGIQS